jgi:hypothetical protein
VVWPSRGGAVATCDWWVRLWHPLKGASTPIPSCGRVAGPTYRPGWRSERVTGGVVSSSVCLPAWVAACEGANVELLRSTLAPESEDEGLEAW